jgi:hypothetical protein
MIDRVRELTERTTHQTVVNIESCQRAISAPAPIPAVVPLAGRRRGSRQRIL